MKYWTAKDIAEGAKVPNRVVCIANVVFEAIAKAGWPGVHFDRIGRSDHEDDVNRIEVDVELAPGVMLPTIGGARATWNRDWRTRPTTSTRSSSTSPKAWRRAGT